MVIWARKRGKLPPHALCGKPVTIIHLHHVSTWVPRTNENSYCIYLCYYGKVHEIWVRSKPASCIAYQYYVLQLWILSLAFIYNRNLYVIYSTIEWKREINHWPSSPVELASRLIIINIIINVVVSQSEILYIYFTDGNPWQSDK